MKNFSLFFACCLILFSISLIPLLPESFSQESEINKFEKAENLLKEKNFSELLVLSEDVLVDNPNDMIWLYYQARSYEGLGDYKKAIEIFENILKDNDIITNKIIFHYAVSLYEEKQYELSLQYFEVIDEEDDFFTDSLNFKGLILINIGQYEEALETFETLISLELTHTRGITNKAAALLKLERYDESLETIEKSLLIEPKDSAALAVKGDIFFHMGEFGNAEKFYTLSILENPENIDTKIRKGLSLSQLSRFEEAHSIFDSILNNNPNHVGALVSKAKVFFEEKKFDDSSNILDRVLKVESENIDALNMKGGIFFVNENYETALEFFNKSLEIDENDIEVLNNKVLALGHLGNYEEVLATTEQILRIDPDNEQANQNRKISTENLEVQRSQESRLLLLGIILVFSIIILTFSVILIYKRIPKTSSPVDSSVKIYVAILVAVWVVIVLLAIVYIDLYEGVSILNEKGNDLSNWVALTVSVGLGISITIGLFIYSSSIQNRIGGAVQRIDTAASNIETQQETIGELIGQVAEISTSQQTEKENRRNYFEKMIVTALGTTREKLARIKERIGTEHGVINQAIIDEWNTLQIPAERFEMIMMMAGESLNHEISDDVDQIRGTLKNSPSDDSSGLLSQIDEVEELILPLLTEKLDAVRKKVLEEHLAKIERLREKHLSEGSQSKNQDLIKSKLDVDERMYRRMYGK